MASLTAAAAGLVWATLLMCVALGAGQSNESLFPDEGSLPPSVRIHFKEDAAAALNLAVRHGNVVLATADCKDESQKWYRVYTSSSFSGPIELKPFSLVNVQTFQVMTIPSASGEKVGLSSTPIKQEFSQEYLGSKIYTFKLMDVLGVKRLVSVSPEELWTPEKPTRDDGFYQLSVTKNATFTLDGLGDEVRDGTEVGIYFASANPENSIWKLTTSSTTCSP